MACERCEDNGGKVEIIDSTTKEVLSIPCPYCKNDDPTSVLERGMDRFDKMLDDLGFPPSESPTKPKIPIPSTVPDDEACPACNRRKCPGPHWCEKRG